MCVWYFYINCNYFKLSIVTQKMEKLETERHKLRVCEKALRHTWQYICLEPLKRRSVCKSVFVASEEWHNNTKGIK